MSIIYKTMEISENNNAQAYEHNGLTLTQHWRAEGILCGVMKLKNPIVAKGRDYYSAVMYKFL